MQEVVLETPSLDLQDLNKRSNGDIQNSNKRSNQNIQDLNKCSDKNIQDPNKRPNKNAQSNASTMVGPPGKTLRQGLKKDGLLKKTISNGF
ncbi:hypothetical protein ABPG72_019937 [Tetrahymena utriculariae]